MPLAQGTRLGPYEILAPLGAGGMGEVYRAKDPKLGREVAIKVLPEGFAADADRLRRFQQEARAASALNHPNILTIHDLGEHEGAPYMVMELLEGETLRDGLSAGALPVAKALEIAIQVARGLAAAHGKGIVHRDLKPENVFLTRDGVKILDFGLAKQTPAILRGPQSELATQDFHHATVEGSFVGTVGYMSPEQVRGEAVDARSDLFALGLLLYEMLTGRQAFKGATTPDTLSAILTAEPPGMETLGRESGTGLAVVLARCLAKRREDRFSNAQDLAFALQAMAHPSSPGPEPESAEKSIVVLPFENLSPDPDNAYFADGLTEEIIADLSKVTAFRVISRTSAMHFKGTTKPLPEIAQMVKVRFVLEGSVRRAGNNLRITAQLIEAATDAHLWAEKYNGSFNDVFDIQEKVSRAIVDALKVQLTPAESRNLVAHPTQHAEAYDCYLRARAQVLRLESQPVVQAIGLLEDGLRRFPGDPMLMALKAYAHHTRVNIGAGPREELVEAECLAREALARYPDLPLCYTVLGLVAFMKPDHVVEAIRYLQKAVEVSPNDQDALFWLSAISFLIRPETSAELSGRLIALNPLDCWSYIGLWFSMCATGRFTECLAVADQMVALSPIEASHLVRAWSLKYLGLSAELATMADWAKHTGDSFYLQSIRLCWAASQGLREEAETLLTPELLEASRRDFQYSMGIAETYAQLGDIDPALDWLENAIRMGYLNHAFFAGKNPLLAPLRSHPRFRALVEKAREQAKAFEAKP